MFGKKTPDVLVVGGGPVGLFTALVLKRLGVSVDVLEEQWRGASRSYGLALHPQSLRLFKKFGLSERLTERGNVIEKVGLYGDGKRRGELDLNQLQGDSPLVVLPQQELEEVLRDELENQGVEIHWNHRLAGLKQSKGEVITHIQRLAKESSGYSVSRTEWVVDRTFETAVKFVVGADGHRSIVRRILEIGFDEQADASNFAVFEFGTDEETGKELQLVLNQENANVLWPLPNGRFRWSFELKSADEGLDPRSKSRLFVQLRDETFPYVTEESLSEFLAERAPWFEARPQEIGWSAAVRFERRIAADYGEGRVWLVGDAAHLAFPVGIQSMNIGFREAEDLSQRLSRLVSSRGDHSVMKEYESQWKEEWAGLLSLEDRLQAEDADSWVAAQKDRIPACLPASGSDLSELLKQVGLKS